MPTIAQRRRQIAEQKAEEERQNKGPEKGEKGDKGDKGEPG